MTRGGARVRSGPPADPSALRRDRPSDRSEWTALPVGGREGDPPAWPLVRPTRRELALWADEWRRPQAAAWEELGLSVEVAIYVRTLANVEKAGANASLLGKLLQQQNSLGLTVAGMSANRWRIGATAPQAERKATGTDGPSAKDRWKVIHGGG